MSTFLRHRTYRLQTPRQGTVLGPCKARINERLAKNERLSRRQRYTGHKISKEIQQQGYSGSESRVRSYIAQRRREKKKRKWRQCKGEGNGYCKQ